MSTLPIDRMGHLYRQFDLKVRQLALLIRQSAGEISATEANESDKAFEGDT